MGRKFLDGLIVLYTSFTMKPHISWAAPSQWLRVPGPLVPVHLFLKWKHWQHCSQGLPIRFLEMVSGLPIHYIQHCTQQKYIVCSSVFPQGKHQEERFMFIYSLIYSSIHSTNKYLLKHLYRPGTRDWILYQNNMVSVTVELTAKCSKS